MPEEQSQDTNQDVNSQEQEATVPLGSEPSPAPVTPESAEAEQKVEVPQEPVSQAQPVPQEAQPVSSEFPPEPVSVGEQAQSVPETPVATVPPASSSNDLSPIPSPSPGEGSMIRQLLLKAKEAIQLRKRKKLEKIMGEARLKGKITNDDVQRLLRCSHATATRYLSQLVKEGRLKPMGHPRDARYEPLRG